MMRAGEAMIKRTEIQTVQVVAALSKDGQEALFEHSNSGWYRHTEFLLKGFFFL